MARELIAARARAGLSQADVAQRMGTTQSAVARLESGQRPPSLRSVQRYAQAIACHARATTARLLHWRASWQRQAT